MRKPLAVALAATILGSVLGSVLPGASLTDPAAATAAAKAKPHRSALVRAVLSDRPTAFLQGLRDLSGHGASGAAVGRPRKVRMPNGDPAFAFDGRGQHLRFSKRSAFEIPRTGILTAELWMRPATLQFPRTEGSGYVYVMGKGNPGAQEWFVRMYSRSNAEARPNRISGYAFNPRGGLGAGSYFQDRVLPRRWIHVALVINAKHRSARYPSGYTRIYKNGVLRDTDSLKDYDIVPRSGSAPLRIGTGYLGSFFQGAVGDVAFFDKELGGARIRAHYLAGRSR
jgi:hypothetical protein